MDGLLSQSRILNSSIFGGGGIAIKSVQHISYVWNDTTTTKDISITSVDNDKSLIFLNFSESVNATIGAIAVAFINATTIRLYRNTGSALTQPVKIQVVEFNGVKSKQTGANAQSGTSRYSVTVTKINIEKSILVAYCTNPTADTSMIRFVVEHSILDSETIQLKTNAATDATTYWQLLEFK